MSAHEGAVVFQDGWHHVVTADGDVGARLVSEDGAYREATDADVPHNERYGVRSVFVAMEDGTATTVTANEYVAVQALLAELRGENGG